MKRFKSMSLKKKRALAIAGVSAAILAVGGTIAYNQTVAVFNNKFNLVGDNIKAIDIVPPVDDWQPCEEYPKTAVVKNENDTPRYVRMKINDYWRVKNSTQTDHETSDLPMTWTDGTGTHKYAFYNTQNDDKWSLESDGYYYYYQPLAGGATTESLLKSAKFNCDANLAGEMTYSQDGHVAENSQSNYSDSEYHIYVIFETSDVPFPPPGHTVDCNSNILYDAIACQTNGPDDNVDFRGNVSSAVGNGNGVNTLSAHQNDSYPVYYYRGDIENNYVIFADKCWRAMRTTGTGGVKLVYNGVLNYGMCVDFVNVANGMPPFVPDSGFDLLYNNYTNAHTDTTGGQYAPHLGGFMHTDLDKLNNNTHYGEFPVGKNAEWNGSEYVLQDTIMRTVTTLGDTGYEMYRFYCPDFESSHCSEVVFSLSYDNGAHRWYILRDGKRYEDYAHENNIASDAKDYLDGWFESNLLSYQSQLEDTQFCNDRSYDLDYFYSDDYYNPHMYFDVYYRNNYTAAKADKFGPSVDCVDNRDAFTTSSANGNGALTYPIGMITADEVTLAGIQKDGGSGEKTWLYVKVNTRSCTWTMSPSQFVYDELSYCSYLYPKSTTTSTNNFGRIQPVVSLKEGTTFSSGDGTLATPYVIGQ